MMSSHFSAPRWGRLTLLVAFAGTACGPAGPEAHFEANVAALRSEAQASAPRRTLTTVDDRIVAPDGKSVQLHGINWFGFNNGQTMLDGLWGNDPIAADFATAVLRLRGLGFNAVRLPFSFQDLHGLAAKDFSFACALPSLSDVAASISPPGSTPAGLAPLPAPPPRAAGRCNGYLPASSVFDRFVWVAKFFAHNGFYVLVDNHLREDQTALNDRAAWLAGWTELVAALVKDDRVMEAHLLVDLLNEPDQFGLRWELGAPHSVGDLYLAAMDAISAVTQPLFLVEGTGQGGLQANWGDGFATDPALVGPLGLSDPSAFFAALAAKPYAAQVVLAPHVYGPAVSTNFNASAGTALFQRLSRSFGAHTKVGVHGKRFAVAIGELGSKFTDPHDIATMTDLSRYLRNSKVAQDGAHRPIPNWFYWAWNPNSGDTGGLLADDAKTLQWTKLAFLRTLGLKAPKTPAAATPPAPGAPTAGPPSGPPAPPPQPAAPPPPSPTPAKPGACRVLVKINDTWPAGPTTFGSVDFEVVNLGPNPIPPPWSLAISSPSYTQVGEVWNWTLTSQGKGSIAGTAAAGWQTLQPGGPGVPVGAVIGSSSTDLMPTSVTLQGVTCTVVK